MNRRGAQRLGRTITGIVAGLAFGLSCTSGQGNTVYMSVLSSLAHQWNRADNPIIGLFVSTDRGMTWQHRGWREYIRTFHSVEGADGTLWSACGNGVLRSRDGGASWKVTTGWEVTEVLRIAVNPKHPDRVFAATAYGPIASTDGGETWEFRRNGLTRRFVGDICIDRERGVHLLLASETGVFTSNDEGHHWRSTSLRGKDIRTIVQDPVVESMFWAGTENDGIWSSSDGGRTWLPANDGLAHRTVYAIVIDAHKPALMFAGTHGGGVYRSTDHGKHWKQCAHGLTNLDVHSMVVLHASPSIVFAGTLNGGLFQSTDQGETWTFNSQAEAQVWGLSFGEGRRVGTLSTPVARAGDSDFVARKTRVLEVAAGESEYNLLTIAAKLRTGRDLPQTYHMLDSMAHDRAMGGMFFCYSMIGVYLFTHDVLPDSLTRSIREAYRIRTMYRGDTENHWVMYYTGLYLASQTWPDDPGTMWFNGKSSRENFAESREWLQYWMKTTSAIGQGEFDSPTYMSVFLSPMLVLQEFSRDSVMKRRAGMMVDLLLADFAAEHLEGSYGGGHSRDYPEDIINPLGAPSTMWAWLYFGRPRFEQWNEVRYRPRNRGSWETVFGALSSYRLPVVIEHMALDRTQPYVHREKKRTRNIIRFHDEANLPVYKYTYMTKDFVLGSLQGGILQPIQQHTWDVTFAAPEPNNTLFTLHPYASGRELAMFFPEEQSFLAAEVDRYHKVYTSPDKWNSSSPYEQTFQYRGSLIVLYNIAEGTQQSHIDGFFPSNLDERAVDSSGWIFCRKGSVYIGMYPLAPYTWSDEKVDWRFRSSALRNGVIVDVSSQSEAGSFSTFANELRHRHMDVRKFHTQLTVAFTARNGRRMQFTYGGKRLLDGRPIAFPADKLYDGPWMQSTVGTGVIRMTDGTRTRTLDFPRVRVKETERK